MGDRSGSGSTELHSVVAELDRLRESLAHQHWTNASVLDHQQMTRDLAAIQAGLKRLANELEEQMPEPGVG